MSLLVRGQAPECKAFSASLSIKVTELENVQTCRDSFAVVDGLGSVMQNEVRRLLVLTILCFG